MAITWVSLTTSPFPGTDPTTFLAAAYESRATQIAKLFVPTAAFAGDTAKTLTDGSFNTNPASILKSSTAVLATPSNILSTASATNPAPYAGDGNDLPGSNNDGIAGINPVTAKPLIIRVQRDPFTGDVINYGVFNADGTVPGTNAPYVPGAAMDPFLPDGPDGLSGTAAERLDDPRYLVNRMTGEIYLNNSVGMVGVNFDSAAGAELFVPDPATSLARANRVGHVVGIVDFKALEGAALSTAQQAASELSNVIQSLATLIRGFKDSEKSMLSVIR